jgi:hypothetical protein
MILPFLGDAHICWWSVWRHRSLAILAQLRVIVNALAKTVTVPVTNSWTSPLASLQQGWSPEYSCLSSSQGAKAATGLKYEEKKLHLASVSSRGKVKALDIHSGSLRCAERINHSITVIGFDKATKLAVLFKREGKSLLTLACSISWLSISHLGYNISLP